MIGPLRRRSSWPSSLLTGAIGWLGVVALGSLALGEAGGSALYLAAAGVAVVQVVVMRVIGLARPIPTSIAIGGALGSALALAATVLVPLPQWVALLGGAFIGGNVGLYLGYFDKDDRRIERAAHERGVQVDYGRDAHWLDPFAYGAAAYAIAFMPSSLTLAISAFAVGAMVGVVAAATSHFALGLAKNAAWTIAVAVVVGAAVGAGSGWLFRGFVLVWPSTVHGALAGVLAFGVTAAVGRALAAKEAA